MEHSKIVEYIRGYEKTEEAFKESRLARHIHSVTGGVRGRTSIRRLYASKFNRLHKNLNRTLAFTPT